MNTLFTSFPIEMFSEPLRGTVTKAIDPERPGRVKFLATYWPARFYYEDCQSTVLPEQPVNIIAIQGITLLVTPIELID